MQVVFGDLSLGVVKDGTQYIFAYNTGGMDSLKKDGLEWLHRTPNLAFWRATTDNDRGNGFSKKSALWMGADLFFNIENRFITVDGTLLRWDETIAPQNNSLLDSPLREAGEVSIRFVLSTCTNPQAEVLVTYTLKEGVDGVRVDYRYNGAYGLPELPICGLRFVFPFRVDSFEWTGLSGETYPDRMYGGKEGHYSHEGLEKCPYVVAQDYGMHMHTHELVIHRGEKSLTVRECGDAPFNFSLLPNTPQEIEAAWHPIDLPLYRRTHLTIAAAVRGVGGIDSWGSEPSQSFHLDAEESYSTSFYLV